MYSVKTILTISGFIVSVFMYAVATPPRDLLIGHFEVQIDYELTPGNPDIGWNLSISYDETDDFSTPEGIVRLDPATTRIIATPETETILTSARGSFANAGDKIWELPQFNRPGEIFLGWRSVIPAGIFQKSINGFFTPDVQGNIIIELIDVSGPAVDAGGEFAMWESKSTGNIEIHYNTVDGIYSNDRLEPVPIGGHTHYAYGMTQPGNYAVTFRALGRINPWRNDPNVNTSSTETFHFIVPFSSTATGAAELRLSLSPTPSEAAVHPLGESVEYAPGQVALITEAVEIGGVLRPYAFAIDLVSDASTAEAHRVGISGSDPVALPAGATLSETALEIMEVSGPGTLQWLEVDGGDFFAFSESGIYRVALRALANQGGSPVNGPRFELVFLAGLSADYDFAAYADSFERTHGLTPGSLADDGSDFDGDNVPDLLEYQLFWEGLDPAIADADKLPLPNPDNSEALVLFHRDTYKDRMDRNTQNIVLEHTVDFVEWIGWSDRFQKFPLEQYETGAEQGNAIGRVQRRAFRLPEGSSNPNTGFFRWRIDP